MYRAQRLAASKIVSLAWEHGDESGVFPCSTPCGIKDRFTTMTIADYQQPKSAQRLAASKIVSHIDLVEKKTGIKCSTPCGIKDRFTPPIVGFRAYYNLCSTPCGIKDRFTTGGLALISRMFSCSTPCGIKDRFTGDQMEKQTKKRSAQRLAASKIVSLIFCMNAVK